MKNFCGFFFLILISYSCAPSSESTNTDKEKDLITVGEKITIYSEILGEEREIWLHVPQGFYGMDEQSVKYPVVYVMDGESQFIPTVGILNHLCSPASASDEIPQMIIVGIVSVNRDRDLTPTAAMNGKDSSSINNTGGAGLLAEFIKNELIPYIDANYSTSAHRVLVGHSLGGLFVLNTLIKFPELFQNYLAIDPFMRWDDQKFSEEVINALRKNNYPHKKLYIATANNMMTWMKMDEVRKDTSEIMKMMRCNIEFKDELESQAVNINYVNKYYENENHFLVPSIATYEGFRYFYDFHHFDEMMDYYHPDRREEDIVEELKKHYNEVSNQLGYDVMPMESYINSWGFGFVQFENPEIASSLFDYNIENYPGSANVYSSKGYFLLGQQDTINALKMFEKSFKIKETEHVEATIESLKN